jgi:hypothetical protein
MHGNEINVGVEDGATMSGAHPLSAIESFSRQTPQKLITAAATTTTKAFLKPKTNIKFTKS